MPQARSPFFIPAVCILSGVSLAGQVPPIGGLRVAAPLAVLIIALGWGLRSRLGWGCVWLGVGLMAVWGRPDPARSCLDQVDTRRPVQLVAEQDQSWQPRLDYWESSVRVRRVRQGVSVRRCDPMVRVRLTAASKPVAAAVVRIKGIVLRSNSHRNGTSRHPVLQPARAFWRMHLKSTRFWVPELGADRSHFIRVAHRLRAWLEAGFEGSLEEGEPGPALGAARALVLGDRRQLDDGLRASLRRFGLSHLFAVSGLHVALVALMVQSVLGVLPQRTRRIGAALGVIVYLLLVGARSSILRATIMVLLGSFAVSADRPSNPRQALCLAAAGLALVEPSMVRDIGYQLTVSASAGILWLKPRLEERWTAIPAPIRPALAATVGAQLASLPWSAAAFSTVHPIAPAINLIAIPWMAGFGVASFVGVLSMRVLPISSRLTAAVLDFSIQPLIWLEGLPASGIWTWPIALTLSEGLVAALALTGGLLIRAPVPRVLSLILGVSLLVGPALEQRAEVIVLDVGQGDAILLHDGSRAVLIDGGGWRRGDLAAAVTLPALARLGIRRLDGILVTHSDVDHCRGVVDLLRYLPVAQVWTGPESPGSSPSDCVRQLVSSPGVRWRRVWKGVTLRVGRIGLEVLHPATTGRNTGNDASLVVRASVAGRSIVLTGDLEARGERELLRHLNLEGLRGDILKVAHHGSRTSSTERFVRAVSPTVATISAGRRNRYGHPSAQVVGRLRETGVHILRTDRDGMIRIPLEPTIR